MELELITNQGDDILNLSCALYIWVLYVIGKQEKFAN